MTITNYVAMCLLFGTLMSCTTISNNVQTTSENDPKWKSKEFAWASYIDYKNPEKYLCPGELSDLSKENLEKVQTYLSKIVKSTVPLAIIKGIYKYMQDGDNFYAYAAGGSLIAKRTADRIFEEKSLSGCHDWGLVLCTLLRKYGIPAVYVDTALVGWAQGYLAGGKNQFDGHIFIEAFVNGKWILLDSTSPYAIKEYDPQNPLLGFYQSGTNYFVMFKGLDPWDYGIYSNNDITEAMISGAKTIVTEAKKAPRPNIVTHL